MNTSTQADYHNSSNVGLSSPQYHLCSPASEDIRQGSLNNYSFKTKETVSERELEPSAVREENGHHRTQYPVVTCSDDEAELPLVVITDTDQDVIQADASQKKLPSMAADFDLALVSERIAVLQGEAKALVDKEEEEGGAGEQRRWFRAKINPASNNQAEEELRKQIR